MTNKYFNQYNMQEEMESLKRTTIAVIEAQSQKIAELEIKINKIHKWVIEQQMREK